MLWRTSTKPDRSKVLNMTEKTFSIPLVPEERIWSLTCAKPSLMHLFQLFWEHALSFSVDEDAANLSTS